MESESKLSSVDTVNNFKIKRIKSVNKLFIVRATKTSKKDIVKK